MDGWVGVKAVLRIAYSKKWISPIKNCSWMDGWSGVMAILRNVCSNQKLNEMATQLEIGPTI